MKLVKKKKTREVEVLKGVLGCNRDDSPRNYYFSSRDFGELLLVYDTDIESQLAEFLWKEVTLVGYRIENSNLFAALELIPPDPTEKRSSLLGELRNRYPQVGGEFSRALYSCLAAT